MAIGPLKMRHGATLANLKSSMRSSSESSGNLSSSQMLPQLIEENLHYRNQGRLSIGQINRFTIHYHANEDDGNVLEDDYGNYIWLRVRNVETQFFRPINFTGPFSFYIDITPYNFDHREIFDERIEHNNDIKPGQSFNAKLRLNHNSLVEDDLYSWTVDVISQLAMTTKFIISYDFMIGYEYKLLRKVHSETTPKDEKAKMITVKKQTTKELWEKPPKRPNELVHLVILTHGIFSNVGADMLYLKEQIEQKADSVEQSNIIVRGYDGNVGQSEKGIRFLGKRVAKYVLDLCDTSPFRIDRISFVAHSLGGPVQAYAISHIVAIKPEFFKTIVPVNFISLAGPFLGILSDFPMAVSWALDIGALGRTGRDLTLSHRFPSIMKKFKHEDDPKEPDPNHKLTAKPILEVIPLGPVHKVFESFQNRTLYANAVNDGIVPLRTSALLYLDWRGLGDLAALKKKYEALAMEQDGSQNGQRAKKGSIGEIPQDSTLDCDAVNNQTNTKTQEQNDEQNSIDCRPSVQLAKTEKQNQNEQNVSDPNLIKKHSKFSLKFNTNFANNRSDKGRVMELQNEEQDNEHETNLSSSPDTPSILRPPTLVFKTNQNKSRRKKLKKYIRTQTRSAAISECEWVNMDDVGNANSENDQDKAEEYHIPPAASTFLSAANVMLSPCPDQEYLMNPDKRLPTILHDKRYTYEDLPPAHFSKKLKSAKAFKYFIKRDKNVIEERIAREWHWKMEWRKVLVVLKPDAHNNIVVRRKFSNAFGWGVIDHLVDNHFGEEAAQNEKDFVKAVRESEIPLVNTKIDNFY